MEKAMRTCNEMQKFEQIKEMLFNLYYTLVHNIVQIRQILIKFR